ncbi:MAG: alpha-rhamnosidase, partial [Pedobacter sp.]
FKYYLHQALAKAGLGNDYMKWLDIWRKNIEWGLTTWTEDSNVEYTRSDCHAWGSSPNIEFYRIVLGIDTDAPGFQKVKIEPHLGEITNVQGEIPNPAGQIKVKYVQQNGKWNMSISLPGKVTGTFIWKGKTYVLKAGENSFTI